MLIFVSSLFLSSLFCHVKHTHQIFCMFTNDKWRTLVFRGMRRNQVDWGGCRPVSSSGFKPRGHRQRRAVISLGWRMNMITRDEQEGDNCCIVFSSLLLHHNIHSHCTLHENGFSSWKRRFQVLHLGIKKMSVSTSSGWLMEMMSADVVS